MAYKNRVEEETTLSPSSSSLSEALLFATMCIIGLPVDVHVKDGSVYSGIFYTACVEKDYGIVLKKAKLTKKGTSDTNVTGGTVVETLVILSGDLVQVVAKGVLLPSDGVAQNIVGDNVESILGNVYNSKALVGEAKKSAKPGMDRRRNNQRRSSMQNGNGFVHGFAPTKDGKEKDGWTTSENHVGNSLEVDYGERDEMNVLKIEEASVFSISNRQVEEDCLQEVPADSKQKCEFNRELSADVQSSNSSLDATLTQVRQIEERHTDVTSKLLLNGASCDTPVVDDQCSDRPSSTDTSLEAASLTSPNPVAEITIESSRASLASSTETVPLHSLECNKNSKEFKLNPGAKIFSPSFANQVSATPTMPTIANVACAPGNPPIVALAAAQPDIGISSFAPRSSPPSKFVPYSNLIAGTGGGVSQFSQPTVGHIGTRAQPLRYAGQHHPVQAAPPFLNPNSQVMVGRFGQLVYVQPVSQDLIHGAPAISPIAARPLLTTHQVQFPKHQGAAPGQAIQLCVPQPLIASSQQPYAMPGHIPVFQPPFPATRPIPVPGSNGFFTAKFP